MAAAPQDHFAAYGRAGDAPRERSVAEHIFIWIGWALCAAFWGLTFTTFSGILEAVARPTPMATGGADVGGIGWLLMDVVGGIVLLGLAMAWGSWMFARRNRALDPLTEARTAALYNTIERQGGEDMTSRSPDLARSPRQTR